eukprot:s108_g3.t1
MVLLGLTPPFEEFGFPTKGALKGHPAMRKERFLYFSKIYRFLPLGDLDEGFAKFGGTSTGKSKSKVSGLLERGQQRFWAWLRRCLPDCQRMFLQGCAKMPFQCLQKSRFARTCCGGLRSALLAKQDAQVRQPERQLQNANTRTASQGAVGRAISCDFHWFRRPHGLGQEAQASAFCIQGTGKQFACRKGQRQSKSLSSNVKLHTSFIEVQPGAILGRADARARSLQYSFGLMAFLAWPGSDEAMEQHERMEALDGLLTLESLEEQMESREGPAANTNTCRARHWALLRGLSKLLALALVLACVAFVSNATLKHSSLHDVAQMSEHTLEDDDPAWGCGLVGRLPGIRQIHLLFAPVTPHAVLPQISGGAVEVGF